MARHNAAKLREILKARGKSCCFRYLGYQSNRIQDKPSDRNVKNEKCY